MRIMVVPPFTTILIETLGPFNKALYNSHSVQIHKSCIKEIISIKALDT